MLSSFLQFQSTYLYKVRLNILIQCIIILQMFQSTYLYKVRHSSFRIVTTSQSFNPRTYIRYDFVALIIMSVLLVFQSTYLYKVRLMYAIVQVNSKQFQSTYLYKVRQGCFSYRYPASMFQSTYLYKVRPPVGP